MGFGGLSVDVGFWHYSQRQQQNAADAAAIGGAQQLLYSGCGNQSAAQTAAYTDSAQNGYTNGSGNVSVNVQNPPSSGPLAGSNCAVLAQVDRQQVPSFFTKLFGVTAMRITTQAVAQVVANNNDCIIMLDPTQNTNFNSSNVTAPDCTIQINGTANFNGSTVQAQTIGEGNYSGSNNGGTFTEASPQKTLPVVDPCSEITSCAYLTNNSQTTSPCSPGSPTGTGPLQGGCYNNLNLHGQTVTLQSGGLFVLNGSTNFNGATINGTGVTLYVPANSSVNFNSANVSITPPTTGNWAGVSYFQVSGNTNNVNLNGTNTNVGGLIYAPSAHLNYNGSYGQYTLIIAAYANLNGSTGEDFGNPPVGSTFIKNVVLSQ